VREQPTIGDETRRGRWQSSGSGDGQPNDLCSSRFASSNFPALRGAKITIWVPMPSAIDHKIVLMV